MALERRKSKEVRIGNLTIGGNSPIAVQSMLNIPAHDIEGSVRQAKALEKAGCQIIRAAIPDVDAVKLIPALKEAVKVPIVADIHFDYRLALESISAGVDKIRINPGNIGSKDRVKAVADACANNGIPIRVASTAALSRRIFSQNTALPPHRLLWTAQWDMCACLRSAI